VTRPEWIEVVQVMRVNWPHATIPKESIAKWYEDVKHLPGEQVRVAAEVIYREGREFPPNGALLVAKVSELSRDDPDHGEAWRLVREALWKHAIHYEPRAFYAYLNERSPAVAEAARRYGFEAQGGYLVAEEGTVRAQFREIYKAVCRERKHDDAYAGLPSAGLRGLEKGPRRLESALARALPERTT